jgi:hypothetical protein
MPFLNLIGASKIVRIAYHGADLARLSALEEAQEWLL